MKAQIYITENIKSEHLRECVLLLLWEKGWRQIFYHTYLLQDLPNDVGKWSYFAIKHEFTQRKQNNKIVKMVGE